MTCINCSHNGMKIMYASDILFSIFFAKYYLFGHSPNTNFSAVKHFTYVLPAQCHDYFRFRFKVQSYFQPVSQFV